MKTNLRLLCLGLAAMTFTAGFAQAENVTSKLRNADMEEGVRGWSVDGEGNIFGKNTKIGRPGFHGVSNMVLENWKSDASTGLTDNSISQTVRNLPAGISRSPRPSRGTIFDGVRARLRKVASSAFLYKKLLFARWRHIPNPLVQPFRLATQFLRIAYIR